LYFLNNEEKILGILENMQKQMDSMGKRMDSMDKRMDSMGKRMDSMDKRMDSMDKRMGTMETRMDIMETRMDTMQETLTRVAVTQENIVLPRLQLLAEGHSSMMDRMPQKSRVEALEEDVAVLKSVAEAHTIAITELKAAK